MKILTIDKSDFLKGMSLTDYSGDKGFSPLSKGFEIDRNDNLGILLPGRSLTEYSTDLAGNPITKVEYKKPAGSFSYYLICENGKIYETNAVTPAHTLKDTVTGKTFAFGISSVLVYQDGFYATSTDDIYYDPFTFTSPDKTWWTVTKGKTALTTGVPHKLFEFGGVMYGLNGNKIFSWNGTTATEAAFSLPTGWIITDAEVDNDVVYLTATKNINDYASNSETKIFVWNGISTTNWLREVVVFTPAISAIKKSAQGFIFWAGRNMYFFDGYSYQWMRYINQSPNFNQVVSFGSNVYFAAYQGVASYNTSLKTFTIPVIFTGVIYTLGIACLDYIDIFTNNSKMYRGLGNTYSGAILYSNQYDLVSSNVRKIVFGFGSALATNSTYTLNIFDETLSSVYSSVISKAVDGAKSVVVRNNLSIKLNLLQLQLAFNNSANSPLRFIHIHYEPSENYVGK